MALHVYFTSNRERITTTKVITIELDYSLHATPQCLTLATRIDQYTHGGPFTFPRKREGGKKQQVCK